MSACAVCGAQLPVNELCVDVDGAQYCEICFEDYVGRHRD